MTIKKIDTCRIIVYILILISIFWLNGVVSQDYDEEAEEAGGGGGGGSQNLENNPAAVQLFSDVAFSRFSNISSVFKDDIKKQFGFCITDVDKDWNDAFNFSKNTNFLGNCVKTTKGDMAQRLCTAAEIKFYFESFYQSGQGKKSGFLKPNKNYITAEQVL
ncbi:white-brown-complex ABC transporter family [Corchorus olitorius]|uniref:White-brown-complex ABC transporter family n=1 Tax=Corchorus olitorius TaxID=93759 RepID=A0A1R3J9Q7_9ROSI|nr:white-brown-complex ABC transporter family [Corchorus olitorius]